MFYERGTPVTLPATPPCDVALFVPLVSRSCKHFPDGFNEYCTYSRPIPRSLSGSHFCYQHGRHARLSPESRSTRYQALKNPHFNISTQAITVLDLAQLCQLSLKVNNHASTAPCTSRRMRCPTHCASYGAPCQPLLQAFSGWIQ